MKKDVKIKLTSRHNRAGEEPEISEILAAGTYELTGDGEHRIIYEESQQIQDENGKILTVKALNTVRILDKNVEITRSGEATSHMVFGIGQKHSMNYNTPYGIIEMDILTNNLEKNIDEKLITLKVEYDLNMENQLLSKSVIEYNIEYI